MIIGEAFVAELRTNRAGDRSERFRVTASYDMEGTLGDITFDAPIADAMRYWVGQRLAISVAFVGPSVGTEASGSGGQRSANSTLPADKDATKP